MLHEFAVEPACFRDWDRFAAVAAQFGVHHGRLVSRFPRDWQRLAWQEIESWFREQESADVAKARAEECLRQMKEASISSGRDYGSAPGSTWLDKALHFQQFPDTNFKAILARQRRGENPAVISYLDAHDGNSFWRVDQQRVIDRSVVSICDCVTPLLRISRQLLLVDANFDPNQSRWRTSLYQFLVSAQATMPNIQRIEYHTLERALYLSNEILSDCRRMLPDHVPNGVQVDFIVWSKRNGGDTLHARYVLTDMGGIGFDYGLDPGDRGHVGETTDVRILGKELYARRWSELSTIPSAVFGSPEGSVVISGRR